MCLILNDLIRNSLINSYHDTRDIKSIARWDAYLHVLDPDALAAEFLSQNVVLLNRWKRMERMTCMDSRSWIRRNMFYFSGVLAENRFNDLSC
jgi:hypothetical protein